MRRISIARRPNMIDLWRAVAELGLELHPDRLDMLADRIRSIESVHAFGAVHAALSSHVDRSLLSRLEEAWTATPETNSHEVAAAIKGARATATLADSRGSIELVWTGPSTGFVPVRHTERVLCEVIDAAQTRLILISFVAYPVPSIVTALNAAVARNVQVDLILESSVNQGGNVSYDSVAAMKAAVTSANMYGWKRSSAGHSKVAGKASVHAKSAVADGQIAFITSANFSEAAMERNMELGVLVRNGPLAANLERHLDALITTETVERI